MRTQHQTEVFNKMMSSEHKIVNFNGPAGVGKTFCINLFLEETLLDAQLTATTNKALSHYEVDGKTTASFLGYTMVYGELRQKKKHEQKSVDILIVDESSMLTRQLLKSIITYVEKRFFSKVILVGDPIQLQIDQFLDLSQFPSFELTEPMRQIEDNILKDELKILRSVIEKKGSPMRINDDGVSIIRHETHEDFLRAYKNSNKNKYILAYKNQTVRVYNRKVVKEMYGRSDEYNEGDMLIALSMAFSENRKEVLLKNREEFLVETVVDKGPYWLINSNIKVPKTKKWLEDQLEEYKVRKDWSNFYRIKESFVFVHHSYAGTVHSAQGATFEEVFIDVTDFAVPNDPLHQTLLRLMYVGLSRAKITAHMFTGGERTWKGLE